MAAFSPLARMPPEIIVQITHLLDVSDQYHCRRRSLRSLANTSRRLFDLVSPFLWREIRLKDLLNCAKPRREMYADLVQSLTIKPDDGPGPDPNPDPDESSDIGEATSSNDGDDSSTNESDPDVSSEDEAPPGGQEAPPIAITPRRETDEVEIDRFLAHWGPDRPLFPAVRIIVGVHLTCNPHMALIERIARRKSSVPLKHISITSPTRYIALSLSYAAHRFPHLRHIELVVAPRSGHILDSAPAPFDSGPVRRCKTKDVVAWTDQMLARHVSQSKLPLLQAINIRPSRCRAPALVLPSSHTRVISSLMGPISRLSSIESLTTVGQPPTSSTSLHHLTITVYSQRSISTISQLTSLAELSVLWGGIAEFNVKPSAIESLGKLTSLRKLDLEISPCSGVPDVSLSQGHLMKLLRPLLKLETLRLRLDHFVFSEQRARKDGFLLAGIATYLRMLVKLDLDLDCDIPHGCAQLPTQRTLQRLRLLIDHGDSDPCALSDLRWVPTSFIGRNLFTEPDRRLEACRKIFPCMTSFETAGGRYRWRREGA